MVPLRDYHLIALSYSTYELCLRHAIRRITLAGRAHHHLLLIHLLL